MKNSLFFSMLFLLSFTSYSQPQWTKVHNWSSDGFRFTNKSTYIDNALLGDTLLLITGRVNMTSCSPSSLLAYDSDGNYLWSKRTLEKWNVGGYHELVKTLDDYIYTVGYPHPDDHKDLYHSLIFSVIDKNGEVVYQDFYKRENGYAGLLTPESMDVHKQNGFILSTHWGPWPYKGAVFRADTTGEFLWMKGYDFVIREVLFSGADSFILRSEDYLYKADAQGMLTDSTAMIEPAIEMYYENDTVYLLYPNRLVTYDANLRIMDTLIHSDDIVFQNIKSFGNIIWLMGLNEDEIFMLSIDGYQLTDTLNFDLYVDKPDFLVAGEQFIFMGNSPSGQITLYSYNINVEPDAYPWPDIELIDFDISNIVLNYVEYGEITFARDFDFDATLTIRNNGSETINSIDVFSLRSGGFNCYFQYYYRNFTDLSIPPSGEIIIDFGRSNEFDIPREANEICFEILAPDAMLERNTDNNVLCKSFTEVLVEPIQDKEKISLYPNPVYDILYFEGTDMTQFELLDTNGKILIQQKAHEGQNSLDVSGLSPGVYFFRQIHKGLPHTTKIIKANKY